MGLTANSFGQVFVAHTFGESHGEAMGVVIDGCPSGVIFDKLLLKQNLKRRRPGQKDPSGEVLVTSRAEEDECEVLSGVWESKTLGTPIAIVVKNRNQRSKDYEEVKRAPRQGHADDLWADKFGHSDWRGGGRASGRETVARVMAGSVAQMVLKHVTPKLNICGYVKQVGPLELSNTEIEVARGLTQAQVEKFSGRMPSEIQSIQLVELLKQAKKEGQSYGGVLEFMIKGVPRGLGQPVFHKLKADMASALMSIGATFQMSLGPALTLAKEEGSQLHREENKKIYGGIRGGLSTGEDIICSLSFKPTSSVNDVAKKGRHDPCIVMRALPVVESMLYHILVDHILWKRLDRV